MKKIRSIYLRLYVFAVEYLSILLNKRSIQIFPLLLFSIPVFSQDKPGGGDVILPEKYASIHWRCSLLPVVSLYNTNPNLMSATQATAGLGLSARAEFKINPKSTMKLLFGADYLNEGMKFDSYYFAPGYSVLFDRNFNFTHHLHISEFYIPILFKQSFTDEDKKVNSAYISGGWAFRYLMGANYKITEKDNGATVAKGFSGMYVEHKFLTDNSGSALMIGTGMEHKLPGMQRSVFFEIYFHYNLSRIHYSGDNNSNDILFKNNSLTISVGYEF